MRNTFRPTIEKGIPPPHRGSNHVLTQMEPGDSVLVDESGKFNMQRTASRLKMKIITRKDDSGPVRKFRVWKL